MKFQVGDKIILVHSDEEGEIIDFINEKMVMVEVNGVKFPVYTDQIDFPYFRRFTQKKSEPKKSKRYIEDIKKEKPTSRYKVGEGVWLAFLPVFDKDVFDEDIVEYFKVYLVNQTNDHFRFRYNLLFMGESDFELKNEISANSDFYLHDVPMEDLNDSARFEFEFSLKKDDKKRADFYEASLKVKPRQVFKKIEELKQKQEATFSYPLFKSYPDKSVQEHSVLDNLEKSGYRVIAADKFGQKTEPARTVVDLHIEKLTDDWQNMSNYAKLDLQLKTFEKYYELAVLHHQPQLIVVHGVGSGKLRDEIHDALRLKKEVKSFVNQYHPSFGYGATEVYFQY